MTVALIFPADKYSPAFPGMPRTADQILIKVTQALGNPAANVDYLRQLRTHNAKEAIRLRFKVLLSCRRAGLDQNMVDHAVRPLTDVIFHPQAHPLKRAKWQDRHWRSAGRQIDPTDWHRQVQEAMAKADWSDRSGKTDMVVFKHAANDASRRNDRVSRVSVRTAALACKVSTQTIQKSRKRLMQRGLLDPVYEPDPYRLEYADGRWQPVQRIGGFKLNLASTSNDAVITTPSDTGAACVSGVVITALDPHSVYGAKGVGVRGRLCHQLLAVGAKTFEELADGMGYRTSRSARRHLQREVDLGLVATKDNWTYTLVADVQVAKDSAAECSGAAQTHRLNELRALYERAWRHYQQRLKQEIADRQQARSNGRGGLVAVIGDCDEFPKALAAWRSPGESRWGVPKLFKEGVDRELAAKAA